MIGDKPDSAGRSSLLVRSVVLQPHSGSQELGSIAVFLLLLAMWIAYCRSALWRCIKERKGNTGLAKSRYFAQQCGEMKTAEKIAGQGVPRKPVALKP